MWVTTYGVFEKDEIEEDAQYIYLYTKNVFVDKVNSTNGFIENEEVGSIYYENFLRVKNKNLPLLDDLVFSPASCQTGYLQNSYDTLMVWGGNEYLNSNPWPYQTKIKVKIIAASPEFDQFYKSLYEQKSGSLLSNGDIASAFEPKKVYSNIENGLGIFAGMNETNNLIDLQVNND
jgi:hypothetical protein